MKIYFVKSDASNDILVTNGITAKTFGFAPSGLADGKIDLYSENAAEELKEYYKNNGVNDYEDMEGDAQVLFADAAEDLEDAVLVYDDGEKEPQTVTMAWRVYGPNGGEQEESRNNSVFYDFSENGKARVVEVFNYDKTGNFDYSVIRITRNTMEECQEEFNGQLSDGVFENVKTGDITECEKVFPYNEI